MAAFAPELITHIGSFPVTNTVLHTLLVDAVVVTLAVYTSKHIKKIPEKLQNLMELIIETFYDLTESIGTKKTAKHIFPYVMSFFLFIVVANITSLLPGVGSIGFYRNEALHATISKAYATQTETHTTPTTDTHETEDATPAENDTHTESTTKEQTKVLVPLLRGATSDINVTMALALISVFATHMLSIKLTGIKDYVSRYISWNPVNLFVGILEVTAEITKIISLSFRLFGNIFAGEVALATISKLFAFVFPLPFLFLEGIVGVVQALVFSILTLVFMAILTTPHHAHEEVKEVNH